MKQNWKPGTLVYPLPAVLVSCGNRENNNLMTAAWTGTICTNPAMVYVSIRPERYSYDIIKTNMQFTINLTTTDMANATDFCGVKSGRDTDKWEACKLHRLNGVAVECPAVEEAPISLECRVKSILPLGSHDMFIAEVVNVLADEKYMDHSTGRFDLQAAGLLAYSHGGYYSLGNYIGKFGFSVQKKTK